jgi:hypothetical protein
MTTVTLTGWCRKVHAVGQQGQRPGWQGWVQVAKAKLDELQPNDSSGTRG